MCFPFYPFHMHGHVWLWVDRASLKILIGAISIQGNMLAPYVRTSACILYRICDLEICLDFFALPIVQHPISSFVFIFIAGHPAAASRIKKSNSKTMAPPMIPLLYCMYSHSNMPSFSSSVVARGGGRKRQKTTPLSLPFQEVQP